jgi:uncharacterized damage-inducible protein DinB
MPAAHALLQAREDVERAARDLSLRELWATPGGAASVGFHLRHIAGSIDRLLTYARGAQLDERQRAALAAEGEAGDSAAAAATFVGEAQRAIDQALAQLRSTPRESLTEPREVGRERLPSTVLGLLFHVAEHTQRHVGQIITTAKVVRGQTRDEG